jgi:hypothetical protein
LKNIALAFAITVIFMLLWSVTPLGDWELGLFAWIGSALNKTPLGGLGAAWKEKMGAPLIVWTEPFTYAVVFWVAWALLGRRRARQAASSTV